MNLHVPLPLFNSAASIIKGFIRELQRGFPPKLLLRDNLVTLGLIELYCHYRYNSIEDSLGMEIAASFIMQNISVELVS